MSEAEFNEQKEALICRLLEKPKTLNKRNNRIWNEIDCQQYDFERSKNFLLFKILFKLFVFKPLKDKIIFHLFSSFWR